MDIQKLVDDVKRLGTINNLKRWIVWLLVFLFKSFLGVLVYNGVAGIGLEMISHGEEGPLIWLPMGIGLVMVMRGGWYYLPSVAAGAYFTEYGQTGNVSFAIIVACAYTAGIGACLFGLRKAQFQMALERMVDVVLFVGIVVILGCSITSAIHTLLIVKVDGIAWSRYLDIFSVKWLANALGVLVLAPALLVWHANTRINWRNRQLFEVLLWMAALMTIGAMVFRNWAPTDTLRYPLELSLFPLQAWASVRFGQRGASVGALIVSILAVWELQEVLGPDAIRQITQPPAYVWVFVGVLTCTSLMLAAVVAEHQNREDNVSRNEERLRAIVTAMPDISFVVSASGKYVDAFVSRATLFSDNVTQLVGNYVRDVHGPTVGAEIQNTINEAILTNRLQVIQYPGWDDKSRIYEGRISPMQPVAGEERKVICVVHDITERTEYENRLKQAKEVADAANMAKGEFLAMMSHEIRTPMNAILGFADILSQSPINNEQREYIKIISRSGRDLLELINNILDYSKIESRAITLESTPFNIEDCIFEALELCLPKANAKGIKLDYKKEDSTEGIFEGDALRFRQIILNLVNNAVKFTREGSVTVRLTTRLERSPFYVIEVAVADTGIGIPIDKQDRLFKPFSQIDSSSTRQHGGTGLGLIISKRLAERMGGDVTLQSESGKGSVFTVTVRLPHSKTMAAEMEAPMDNAADPAFAEKHPFSVLVADEEPTHRELMVENLKLLGYQPESVTNAKDALQWLRNASGPTAVLCHLRLPPTGGVDFCRSVRRGDAGQHARDAHIVGITAIALSEEKEMCLNAGLNDYISKPAPLNRLKAALIKYKDRHTPAASQIGGLSQLGVTRES